jgi:DNA-binding SARP family transcriptional activator
MLTSCGFGSFGPSLSPVRSLPRHRLTDQLLDGRFAVAVALAGFGKTTLLAQVAGAFGGPVTWYTVEPGAGPAGCRQELAQALLDRRPAAAELADMDVLLAALPGVGGGRRLVVIDNLHLLDRMSLDLLLRVGRRGSPYPLVLAAGRPADGLSVEAFVAAGGTVLETDDLRFRSWEVERLYREFYGTPLESDAALRLTRVTSGQAARLHRLARAVEEWPPGPVPPATAPVASDAADEAEQVTDLLLSVLGYALPGAGAGADAGRVARAERPAVSFAARLGEVLQAVLRVGPDGPVPSAELHRIAFQAEREGHHWATRAARCLLGLAGCPEDAAQLRAVQQECAQRGDQLTVAFAAGVSVLCAIRAGAAAGAALETAVSRFRAIGWMGAEAWARAALAIVEADLELPDAAERAGQAEAFARAAGVVGPQVVAIGALAMVRPEGREELFDAAWAMAEAAHLPVRALRNWMIALGLPAAVASAAGGARAQASAGGDRPAEVGGAAPPGPAARGGGGRGDFRAAGPVLHGTAPALHGTAPVVAVRCLGGFALTVAGREPDWRLLRPRQQALLRMFAAHAGSPVHRAQLIESFWPELPAPSAVHNLQVAVSRLRTVLEPGLARGRAQLVIRRGESYLLVLAPGSTSDVIRFEHAVRTGRRARERGRRDEAATAFRAALEEYGGELLPMDGAAEWLLPDRERLRQEAADAAATLARLELAGGRPVQAIEAATRSLEIDRCWDAAWRALIAGHESAGQSAAAARARQQYADVLAGLGFRMHRLGPDASLTTGMLAAHDRPKNSISAIPTRVSGLAP